MKINIKSSEYTAPANATRTYKNLGSIEGFCLSEPVEFIGDADNTNTYLLTFQRGASYKKKMWFTLPAFKPRGKYPHKEAENHLEMFINLIKDFALVYMDEDEFNARLQPCLDETFANKIELADLEDTVNYCIKCLWETLISAIHETDFTNIKGYLFMCKTPKSAYANIAIWSNLTRRLYYCNTPTYKESLKCEDLVDCEGEIKDTLYSKPNNVQFPFSYKAHVETEIAGLINGKFTITEEPKVEEPKEDEPTWVKE